MIRKESSPEELEKINDNEIIDFLQEILCKTTKVAVRSEQQLLSSLSANIKREVITMKQLRQLKEDFFDMLKNPNLDDKLYGSALALLTSIREDEIIKRDELQQRTLEILHISNRNVRTISTLSILFNVIKQNQNKITSEQTGQVEQLEKEFKAILFDMLKNPDKNIRMTALAMLSAVLNRKQGNLFVESEEIAQLTKQLMEMSSDMLKNPDKNIRMTAFFVLMSVFDLKGKGMPFGKYEKKLLTPMLVNVLTDMMKDEDTDLQLMLLPSLRQSFLEELIQFDETQAKPLRDIFITMQKSPHRQIREIARRYTAKLGTIQSGYD